MKKLLIITEVDQLKSISDPFRIQLLSMIANKPKTGQMLADELGLPRAKVHYHLKQLIYYNIITVSHTVEKNSIIQKFYRPAAERIVPSINIFNFDHKNDAPSFESYNMMLNQEEYGNLTRDLDALLNNKKTKKRNSYCS